MSQGIETPDGFEPEPPERPQTAQEAQERAERRHPATVTADRLRAHREDYVMDLTPREQDALADAVKALDRVAALNG